MHTHPSRPLALLAALVAVLSLSACNVNISTNILEDGSGAFGMQMVFTPSDIESLASFDTTIEDFCQSTMDEDLPEGAQVAIEQHGEDTWCVMEAPFASLEELKTAYEDGDGIVVNRLEISDNRVYYDLSLDMSTQGSELSGAILQMNWKLILPGKIQTNNADLVKGNTLTWKLGESKVYNLQAESTLSPLGGLWSLGDIELTTILIVLGLACLCGVIVIALAVAFFLLLRRRKAAELP